MNSLDAPWHAWVNGGSWRAHVDQVESLGLLAVVSARADPLRRRHPDAFARVRALAGAPAIPPPGQAVLDQLLAAARV